MADPSFRGTEAGEQMERLAARHGVAFAWHPGFALDVGSIPDDFRGPEMRPLARRIRREWGGGSSLPDAERLGRAAASLAREPDRWLDRGAPGETWQHLKRLWHVLARFGGPPASDRDPG